MLGFYDYTMWLTYLGLLSGTGGIWCAISGHSTAAVVLLALAGFFDLFDGMVARTKKDRTEEMKKFGIQIDSLSDLVCFCVLPSVMLLMLVKETLPDLSPLFFLPVGLLPVLAGLIRLAYFNVSEERRQKEETAARKSFTGIPVTLTSVSVPFFLAIYKALFLLFANESTAQAWKIGYLVFFCAELLFFSFGFLFKDFKVFKVRGKKVLIPVLIGAGAVLCVLLLVLFGQK